MSDTPKTAKANLLPFGRYQDLPARKIKEDVCQTYGYYVGQDEHGKTVQVAQYRSPEGDIIAQKVRYHDKSFRTTGDFSNVTLFGQHLYREGGKRVLVVEGEIDALSGRQMLGNWPVVSLPNGAPAAKKALQRNLEWLESYEMVVLMFDQDEPGQKAAKECVDLFSPGKVALAHLPLKDANEMLKAGRIKEFVSSFWEAQVSRPDGIVNGKDLWDSVSKPVSMGQPYPWKGLNDLLYGLRPREIVTLTAGSGVGKSAVCAEVAYDLAVNHGQDVGYVALEEGVGRTGLRFMGINLNRPIHLPGHEASQDELRKAFEATLGTGRIWSYDHFGSVDSENLLSKLRFLVKGCGVKWLVLDHLSIVISGMDLDGDERRAIDKAMTDLRTFTEETGCGLILVSHLKRPEGKGHEEGAATSLAQLRGSAAIAQLSDAVIGLERNGQAESDKERNMVTLRVLKNRYSGQTGVAGKLLYNKDTGRLEEVSEFHRQDEEDDGEAPF